MVYQSFKYLFVRLGITLFLVLTFGYGMLYFIHEIAMPGVDFDDRVVQYGLIGVCLFFGFPVYGMFGEHRFQTAYDSLKNVDLQAPVRLIKSKFEALIRFTGSSYFLPGSGRRLRDKVVRQYAQYLLSVGDEDPLSLNLYLKAFLQDTQETQFRNILVSVLTRKSQLNRHEIDLLLLILKAEEYADKEILDFLITIFLDQKIFTLKSEPVFLQALEQNSKQSDEIVAFMVPRLLKLGRRDAMSVQFYLKALSHADGYQKRKIEDAVGRCYCEEFFRVVDPVLHKRCQTVYESLESSRQSALMREAGDQKIGERWKRVSLLRKEDFKAFGSLKLASGLQKSLTGWIWDRLVKAWVLFGKGLRQSVFLFFDALNWIGRMAPAQKIYGMLAALVLLVVFSLVLQGPHTSVHEPPATSLNSPVRMEPPGKKAPSNKMHTIQVAAVNKKANADEIVEQLKRSKVEGIYVVKTKRKSKGYWYKIRVGKFGSMAAAQKFAQNLVEQNIINNYFLVSLEKQS